MKIIFILVLSIPIFVFGQSLDSLTDCVKVYEVPDVDAHYPDGNVEMMKFIQLNFEYPEKLYIHDIPDSKIFLEFIVTAEGRIVNVKAIRGIDEEMNHNAIAMIQKMPAWVPAKSNGVYVCSRVRLPIIIDLK